MRTQSMKSSMVLKLLNLVKVIDDIEDLKKLKMYAINGLHSIMICFSLEYCFTYWTNLQ